ncbi:SRPBCC family protein [Microlunatus sp. GCM10028923]|uniref:SRPBCC family protein n=1 Tax=Microlunatus sp. GCM10028923 TaxID=3273400 RepID=UPI0036216E77
MPTTDGHDLVLTRSLPGSIDDAWASITEPDRTARWIGHWEGEGAVGASVKLRLGFEEDTPWTEVKIIECAAPRRLRVLTIDEQGTWDLSLELSSAGDHAALRFVMHRIDPAVVGSVGPGWEYYLDQLVASVTGAPAPSFDDYYPAQSAHFENQVS